MNLQLMIANLIKIKILNHIIIAGFYLKNQKIVIIAISTK